MKVGEVFTLDLEKIGIPKESKILQINYTPNGLGLFPTEIHGNTPIRHNIPNVINLYGRAFNQSKEENEEVPVSVQINWARKTVENEIWDNLIDAVEAFTVKNYNGCVIPSNVSVESALNNLMTEYFYKYAAKDRVREFLNNGATYSYQLNILLSVVADNSGFPKLPDDIRGNLNKLRDLRNSLAHSGRTEKQIDKKTISELICSAAFGLSYLNLLQNHLRSK